MFYTNENLNNKNDSVIYTIKNIPASTTFLNHILNIGFNKYIKNHGKLQLLLNLRQRHLMVLDKFLGIINVDLEGRMQYYDNIDQAFAMEKSLNKYGFSSSGTIEFKYIINKINELFREMENTDLQIWLIISDMINQLIHYYFEYLGKYINKISTKHQIVLLEQIITYETTMQKTGQGSQLDLMRKQGDLLDRDAELHSNEIYLLLASTKLHTMYITVDSIVPQEFIPEAKKNINFIKKNCSFNSYKYIDNPENLKQIKEQYVPFNPVEIGFTIRNDNFKEIKPNYTGQISFNISNLIKHITYENNLKSMKIYYQKQEKIEKEKLESQLEVINKNITIINEEISNQEKILESLEKNKIEGQNNDLQNMQIKLQIAMTYNRKYTLENEKQKILCEISKKNIVLTLLYKLLKIK